MNKAEITVQLAVGEVILYLLALPVEIAHQKFAAELPNIVLHLVRADIINQVTRVRIVTAM